MGIISRIALKNIFKTGNKPGQKDFGDMVDSLMHKEDNIAISKISGLTEKLENSMTAADKETILTALETQETAWSELKNQTVLKYNDAAETVADDILKLADKITGGNLNYKQSAVWDDGTTMTDARVDGIIFKKIGAKYYELQYDGILNVKWFGAKGDGSTDDLQAFNAAIAFAKSVKGANLFIPKGHYKFSDTWLVKDVQGLTIEGYANQNITFTDKSRATCILDFDACPKDRDGIRIENFVGVEFKNLFISYYRGEAGGTSITSNAALRFQTGHDYRISGIRINALSWQNTAGLILGGNSGETCAFMGVIEDVKVFCNSQAIGIGTFGGNTSLNFRSCYVAGGGYFHIEGTIYSSFLNCACDGATYYGYLITSNIFYNSTNLSFISCGAESCGQSGFWIHDYCQNIDFLNPYDANNNTSGESDWGALITINANTWAKNIRVSNPSSYSTHGNYSIAVRNAVDNIFIESTNAKNLKKPIGGSSLKNTSITGDYEWTKFTPTIAGITGEYDSEWYWKRSGKEVSIKGTITPKNGNVSIATGTTVISNFGFDGYGGSLQQTAHIYSQGNAVIVNNECYPQTVSDMAYPIIFIGRMVKTDSSTNYLG